jgi:hypothetical protein
LNRRGIAFREQPALADLRELHARVRTTGTGLVPDHVRFLAENDVIAWPRQDLSAI